MMSGMGAYSRAGLLKRGILLFWSLWISIVLLLNVGDALKVAGFLPGEWKLASGNYDAIVHVTSRFGTPHWIDTLLFLGVIAWEALCAVLFWRALRLYRGTQSRRWRAVYLAFTALLALFGMFILADETFHAYKMEGDHRGIAVLLLASVVTIQLLPDRLRAE